MHNKQYNAAELQERNMQQGDPYQPVIAWRSRQSNLPKREPIEIDVQDGRAEYVLSGPYHLTEGALIEVRDGKVLYRSGCSRPT